MHLSSDEILLWQYGPFKLNVTIATTWGLMLLLAVGSHLITRKLSSGPNISRWQSALEIVVSAIKDQMADVGVRGGSNHLAFIGTLFVFLVSANLCTIFPFYEPPTGSLSTTAALAVCVFVAVPLFGIFETGLRNYLKTYLKPTPLMLPLNIINEFSRTLALAVRLFGNMMSGSMIIAILLTITPLFFPVLMTGLGLLTGMVQAYIFSLLATIYIAAATDNQKAEGETPATLEKA